MMWTGRPEIPPSPVLADPVIARPQPELIPIISEDPPAIGSGRLSHPLWKPSVTADLIASLVSGLNATLGELGNEEPTADPPSNMFSNQRAAESDPPYPESAVAPSVPLVTPPEPVATEAPAVVPEPLAMDGISSAPANTTLEHDFSELAMAVTRGGLQPPPTRDDDLDVELREMLEELKGNTSELKPVIDFETHYSLGLAYNDMDLLDQAIEQVQSAYRLAGDNHESIYIQCCHMLSFCFNKKRIPKLAITWFDRGLKVPDRPEDEYQALRFEIGLCYQEMGDLDKAIEVFAEVYGIEVNYRQVSSKLKELQAAENA